MLKKTIALLLTCVLAVGLLSTAGASAAQAAEEPFHVAYAAVTTSLAPWVIAIANNFEEMCKRNGWDYSMYDGEGNPTKQTEQISSIISDGEADLVILFPVDSEVGVQYVKDLTAAGIDVITLGADVAEAGQSDVLCYVGPNQAEMVKFGTDYVKEKLGADADLNYVLLSGFDVQYDYIVREQAVNEGYADTGYNQLAVAYCGASRNTAMEQMASYLLTYDNIDFVQCLSDEFALGAIQAIEEAGKTGEITVVSLECFKESIPMLKEGKMDMTVTMTGASVVEKLEEVIKAYLAGETLEYIQNSPIEKVTAENADSVNPDF